MGKDKDQWVCKTADFRLAAHDLCAFLEDWKADTRKVFEAHARVVRDHAEDVVALSGLRCKPAVLQSKAIYGGADLRSALLGAAAPSLEGRPDIVRSCGPAPKA